MRNNRGIQTLNSPRHDFRRSRFIATETKQPKRPVSRKRRLLFFVLLAVLLLATVWVLDALFGWWRNTELRHRMALRPNVEVRHRTAEFDYSYETNALGFRGPDHTVDKPAGVNRIAVIGDSFIAGVGVSNDDILTAVLRKQLNAGQPNLKFEILNRGRPGTSIVRELDLYRHYTAKYRPDVVVLAFDLGNDLVEAISEQTDSERQQWSPNGRLRKIAYTIAPNIYLELAMLKSASRKRRQTQSRTEAEFVAELRSYAAARGVDAATAEARFRNIPEKYRAMAQRGEFGNDYRLFYACTFPNRIRNAIDPDDVFFGKAWPRVERHLDLLREAVSRDGAKLAVFIIPDAVMVNRKSLEFNRQLGFAVDDSWLKSDGRTEQAVRAWAARHSVPYRNPANSFRESTEKLYFPMDGHFTPAGHDKAAELLAAFLREHGLAGN